jgi:predicted dehydrogenase
VATRNEQSAREAAEVFGADRWFFDPLAMIRDDQIDVVTIAVKVPAHRELVLAALDAGKAVYCEAPLGRNIKETEEMAGAAGSLHTAIGLQGRFDPAVRRAALLLASGKIGRPLNARIIASTSGFGAEWSSAHDYFNKAYSGANLLTINAGHTLDVLEVTPPETPAVTGEFMGAANNVGEVYAYLLRDMHAGTYHIPGFEHALHNARLIEAIRRAAERGERQKITAQTEGAAADRRASVQPTSLADAL